MLNLLFSFPTDHRSCPAMTVRAICPGREFSGRPDRTSSPRIRIRIRVSGTPCASFLFV
jgi:hypothetical protein